ncbi:MULTISPECIES: rod shape-determining protein MreD [Chryseobacterium]|jgi:rod shape-determining protein MreD|uniref:Rod shape-determining protein MreD n=2 Tax=Chryseobacterium TaxID=59732 RepID=A0AAX2IHM9_9FLAO|nr:MULTISPECIES: rod shape-determining protein MreD [Chryseobacterium]AZB31227.1 rod shape-determining protein MreD [Chryseobacterium balustinum]MBW3520624.1 rod shape-determining protein MreD [Chryseobacterium sp. NKUCC03_KSP]MCD0454251.1 rod shape-determining protein MreD [Chryseobacterium sp. LC2016-27]MCD0476829.1 rod shape-determining protein MreD [Chryseobacterium sp. LC2016-29]MCD1115319.1 rod shape-determining protein MreD [Chryseobacterium turcicum]
MISRTVFTDLLIMAFLVALQVFVLNRITLFGKFTPVLYPVFVMFYPFFRNKFQFLALSFLIGLAVDGFLGTWGINALATTVIAYFRTLIFRTSTDTSTDFFSFQSLQWTQFLLFLFSSISLHQLLVQYIEFFKFTRIFEILFNVLVTSVISFIFIIVYALIFKIKQKV